MCRPGRVIVMPHRGHGFGGEKRHLPIKRMRWRIHMRIADRIEQQLLGYASPAVFFCAQAGGDGQIAPALSPATISCRASQCSSAACSATQRVAA